MHIYWCGVSLPAEEDQSVKCVEWQLQPCVITVIIKFSVVWTPFTITQRWLISFTHWVIQLISWSRPGKVFSFSLFSELNLQLQYFAVYAQWACALTQDCKGCNGAWVREHLQITALEHCQSNWAVNHECELSPFYFEGSCSHVMSTGAHICLRSWNEPAPNSVSRNQVSTVHRSTAWLTSIEFFFFFSIAVSSPSHHSHSYLLFPLQLLLASAVGISKPRYLSGTGMKTRFSGIRKHPASVQWILVPPISDSSACWQTKMNEIDEGTCERRSCGNP